MANRLLTGLLLLLLTLTPASASVPAPAPAPAPASQPVLMADGPTVQGSAGTWYAGATPTGYDPAKPVLLFVHGKGGAATSWWGETVYHGANDMYQYAYNNGFRTAFVDLHPERDMWANAALLNEVLPQITAHFGVKKVVVVAHSKGGVDSNAAAITGASPYIDRVITLGSPHWGTPVADLAFSAGAWWLAALLGQTTEAAYVMQTGYMDWFRSVADTQPSPVRYYTVGGYKCGPFMTALWWGCAYIWGEDDGLVPIASARKPGATLLKEGHWDHDEIRMGSRTWSSFTGVLGPVSAATPTPAAAAADGQPASLANLILRGGEATGAAEGQALPIESGVREVSFTVLSSQPDFTATLVDPAGEEHLVKMVAQVEQGEAFGGAWAGAVTLPKPMAGQWRLVLDAPERAGYFVIASLESDLRATLNLGRGPSAPGGKREAAVAFAGGAPAASSVTAQVATNGQKPSAGPVFAAARGRHQATLTLPDQEGVQNLTVTVTGTLADGTAFERTLVGSFAVVSPQAKGPWGR